MKVYIVIGSWDYEGHSAPIGIYSTREKAEVTLEANQSQRGYDDVEIMEYEIDQDPAP